MTPADGAEGDDESAPLSALTISFPAHGHSYGLYWERPWFVPGGTDQLAEGMCIGVEAMAGRPGVGSAKFEQDVIVTADGAELITKLETHFW
jgi:Xaa-Pro aminopeptidase